MSPWQLIRFATWATTIAICWSTTVVDAAQPTSKSDQFQILAWNIESGGSDADTIARELNALAPDDIVCLSEVENAVTEKFVTRWGAANAVVGKTGGNAKIIIAWNPERFECLGTEEIQSYKGKEFAPGIQFAPLIARLKHKPTGVEFFVAMNHFTRGSDALRLTQAELFSQWGKDQSLPCIAVGGYNFDYDFPTRKGNKSFEAFQAAGVWKWIEPAKLIDNNWADRNKDGKDDYPDSMLDFTFECHAPEAWKISSEVIVREGDFPDSEKTSDHRPMLTVVSGLSAAKK